MCNFNVFDKKICGGQAGRTKVDLSAEGRQQSGQGKALRLPELFQQRTQILLVMLNLTAEQPQGLRQSYETGEAVRYQHPSAQNCARPSRSPSLTAFSRYRKAKYTAMRSSFSGLGERSRAIPALAPIASAAQASQVPEFPDLVSTGRRQLPTNRNRHRFS